jgi:transcription elongation factor GreA
MLNDVEIVEDVSGDVVAVGSVVSLRYVGDDEVDRYLVGSIEERREGVTVVSPDSPLGSALLGHKAGDKVSYEAPSGELHVEVVSIG